MKIFALETDEEKLKKSFLSQHEQILLEVKFSAFLFILRSAKYFFLTLILIAIGVALDYAGVPLLWSALVPLAVWFFFVFFRWITAFIDWRFDVLLVTTEEIVIVDQSSLFRVHIRQINLDNIASVGAESQFWNLFPFGKIHFDLKEGIGAPVILSYIPQATNVASAISDAVVRFQRRRAQLAGQQAGQVAAAKVEQAVEKLEPGK